MMTMAVAAWRRLQVAGLALTLAGCGGGGGDPARGQKPDPGAPLAVSASLRLVAGTLPSEGFVDASSGRQAQFRGPVGAAVDAQGNLYIADTRNHTIRRLSPNGSVTTWAGSPGQSGKADGQGAAARFNSPMGLVVDPQGHLLVADRDNGLIRKISPQGVVTTLAGAAGPRRDGPPGEAAFQAPEWIAVDAEGNVFVTEYAGDSVRRIAPDGSVSTLAGVISLMQGAVTDGPRAQARFARASGLSVDAQGNVYVADSGRVRKVLPSGETSTVATASGFMKGGLVRTASGDLYLAEKSGGRVQRIAADGTRTMLLGDEHETGYFEVPAGVAMAQDGRLFVVDSLLNAIRVIHPGGAADIVAGTPDRGTGYRDGQATEARFHLPQAATRGPDGQIYVADWGNGAIRRIASDGRVSTLLKATTDPFTTPLQEPIGLAIDQQGVLWVADSALGELLRVTPGGDVETWAGRRYATRSVDGPASLATFSSASQVLVTTTGDLFVSDIREEAIRKVRASDRWVSTFAGELGGTGRSDGPALGRRLYTPVGMAQDSAGNFYVADKNNHAIRKITPEGQMTTLAGKLGERGYRDDQGATARFDQPTFMAMGPDQALYVVDWYNCVIRRVGLDGRVTTAAGQPKRCGVALGNTPSLPDDVNGLTHWKDGKFLVTIDTGVLELTLPMN